MFTAISENRRLGLYRGSFFKISLTSKRTLILSINACYVMTTQPQAVTSSKVEYNVHVFLLYFCTQAKHKIHVT